MVTINVLPDDVLLAIFDFHVVKYQDLYLIESSVDDTKRMIESWNSLIHVCRRWRGLVFGSPRRLNLQIFCTAGTSARKSLDVWPTLPLLIQGDVSETSVDNVAAELGHNDRICHINLDFHTTLHIDKLWMAMKVPFSELALLLLSFANLSYPPVLPDAFLGGSAPRLRFLKLVHVPFLGLPNLLLSATHLVELTLVNIPHSGYISPEAMVTCFSVLTSLELLCLQFHSPQSCPDQESQRPPPPTRSVLPALKKFFFKGVNEYLEELVARIDTPRLYQFSTTFFNDIDFNIPELIQFITPTFNAPNEVHVVFDSRAARVTLQRQASLFAVVTVEISCRVPNWQLSSLAQICTSLLPLLSTMESLYIYEPVKLGWKDGIDTEKTEWLELLLPFMAVKNLYLSKQFAPRIAPALQEITGGGTTEVLSTLQNLYLEGFQSSESVQEGIAQFISARQLTSRPVFISNWERYGSIASSNFQSIFSASLQAYDRKTKNKLLDHPLAAQLQSCNSPNAVFTVLQDLVQQSGLRRTDRLKNCLNPTVNVLYAFSATLGEGVSLVSPNLS